MIFDTECVLCSRTVQFVLRHERDPTLRFVGAGSPAGRALAARHGVSAADLDKTFVVVDGERALLRSEAVIRVLQELRAPWRWLTALRVIPTRLRDAAYSMVARHRYAIFGRRDVCFLPDPSQAARFADTPSPKD